MNGRTFSQILASKEKATKEAAFNRKASCDPWP